MLTALTWGPVATSSLVVVAALGLWLRFSDRMLGVIMAFGAGILISPLSYELVYDSLHLAHQTPTPALGLFCGAFGSSRPLLILIFLALVSSALLRIDAALSDLPRFQLFRLL